MENVIYVKIEQKVDTEQNWKTNNPVLRKGEIGFVSDGAYSGLYKLGDGTSKWNDLNYASSGTTTTFPVNVITENTTLTNSYDKSVNLINGNVVITVPLLSDKFSCTIKNISNNTITVKPNDITIDDSSSSISLNKNEFIQILQYNNEYYIINTNKVYTAPLGELTVDDNIVSASEITVE